MTLPPRSSDPSLELNYSRWLPTDRNAAILDLGCGNGRVLRFLSTRGYCRLRGVDRDSKALSSIGDLAGVTLDCNEVNADYLRRQKGAFKLIILRQVIYYIERRDVYDFMVSLKDALADDGVLIIEFFNAALLSSRLTEMKDPFIRTAYSEHSIRRLFDACGLDTHYIGPDRSSARGLRSTVYAQLRAAWVKILNAIYILERGFDDELPRIYTKSIIAVAGKVPDRLPL